MQYGLFLIYLGGVEFKIEVLIWFLKFKNPNTMITPLENRLKINPLETGKEKRDRPEPLLRPANRRKVIEAANRVISIADRNAWIHNRIEIR